MPEYSLQATRRSFGSFGLSQVAQCTCLWVDGEDGCRLNGAFLCFRRTRLAERMRGPEEQERDVEDEAYRETRLHCAGVDTFKCAR